MYKHRSAAGSATQCTGGFLIWFVQERSYWRI